METIQEIRQKIEDSKKRVAFLEANPAILEGKIPFSQFVNSKNPLDYGRRDDMLFPSDIQANEQTLLKPKVKLDIKQIKRKAPKLKVSTTKTTTVVPVNDLFLEKNIKALGEFFSKNACISIKNFALAKKLFVSVFKDEASVKRNYILLAQELDKMTSKCHSLGKAHIKVVKSGQFLLERVSNSSNLHQYISIDFDNKDITVYTIFLDSTKRSMREFIRSTKFQSMPANKALKKSLDFDVNVWKQANAKGIKVSSLQRTLDCFERNHLNISEFINKVNYKSLDNLLLPSMIKESNIKTNAVDTTFVDFKTNDSQAVSMKIAKDVSSLRIS